ncbi:MAG: hypothetical protein JSU94_00880 [Phycisphaerales bacterium]|nr:MAG: hypothetical protein JSU94_00880 [Phycisphaerales bacterium]
MNHKTTNQDRSQARSWPSKRLPQIMSLCAVLLFIAPCEVSAQDDTPAKLRLIHDSFVHQRSLFRNVRFVAEYIAPYRQVLEPRSLKPRFIDVPGEKSILHQQYQLNRHGQFIFKTAFARSDEYIKETTKETGTQTLSFNGELYYCDSRPRSEEAGLGSIFTQQQSFDYSRVMIKPTFFMDHAFNDEILQILREPENVEIATTDDGLWRLQYKDPNSDKFYDLRLDPKQDFMIVTMVGKWDHTSNFRKDMQYHRTDEGFYYLNTATLAVGQAEPTTMNVKDFALNGPEPDYTLKFPLGTRVTDHTKGFPEIYYEGQPGKTADETGDQSIYTIADTINRFEMYEPDIMIENALHPPKAAAPNPKPRSKRPGPRPSAQPVTDLNPHLDQHAENPAHLRYPAVLAGAALVLVGGCILAGRRS